MFLPCSQALRAMRKEWHLYHLLMEMTSQRSIKLTCTETPTDFESVASSSRPLITTICVLHQMQQVIVRALNHEKLKSALNTDEQFGSLLAAQYSTFIHLIQLARPTQQAKTTDSLIKHAKLLSKKLILLFLTHFRVVCLLCTNDVDYYCN